MRNGSQGLLGNTLRDTSKVAEAGSSPLIPQSTPYTVEGQAIPTVREICGGTIDQSPTPVVANSIQGHLSLKGSLSS